MTSSSKYRWKRYPLEGKTCLLTPIPAVNRCGTSSDRHIVNGLYSASRGARPGDASVYGPGEDARTSASISIIKHSFSDPGYFRRD
jgi:hypothetical protein